jgi:hypothetical protein
VAITNQRILDIAGGKVTFIAKDYRDRAVKKPVTYAPIPAKTAKKQRGNTKLTQPMR